MRLHLKSYSLLPLVLLVLVSCSKKVKVPVPADASIVVHIDGNSLSSKFKWEDFKQSELYKLASGKHDMDSLAKKILDNPENSGIDIKSDAFLFASKRGKGGYYGFTCSIKDEKAFAEMIKKVNDDKDDAEKQGSLSVLKKRSAVFTWTSSRFVFIGDNPEMGPNRSYSDYSRSNFPEDSLLKFANEIYDMKAGNSLASNDKFTDMMKEAGDLHVWVNSEQLYEGVLAGVLSITKASDMFKGNTTALTVNFDKGKITIDGKNYYNEKMAAIYAKNPPKNISEDMLKKIPAENVCAVLAMNYSPASLKEILAMIGVDGMANYYLTDAGTSMDDVIKSLKGDVLLAVTDAGMKNPETLTDEERMYYRPRPTAKMLLAASLNDQTTIEKLLALAREEMGKGNVSYDMISREYPHLLKDGWFIAGNDSTLVNGFSSGTTTINHPFISKISGHPIGGYIDIQKILNGFNPVMRSPFEKSIMDESIALWQDVVFYGGEQKDGATIGHVEINFVDKNTSSLKQLNDYFGRIAKKGEEWDKQSEHQLHDSMLSDSVMIFDNKIRVEEVK